ncbi:hypothetical protein [Paraclostridium sordellii]|uniref:hypothetical protein n=1 Tax=Paraclostridium sordellii TaxID=1505 RepID=UPI000540A5B3|nr:hypothetical protein [Paeniclostridium sordellii]MCH1964661.1 hypothetical protein [Paeniclostridium sordellii]MCQ4699156.1 hypothetical protein [Paeniclostridium sordellii]MDU6482815.1 hypothetical protein [Paeniclostridium sordellii]CEK39987.1 hypothetical protein JGS6382_33151 [[Clostridium] sordellii] [Paeniclostridium sordellii]
MNIKLYEVRKIITSYVIIFLTMLMVVFNFYTIREKVHYIRDDLSIVNKIIDEFGVEINEYSINKMNSEYKTKLTKFNNLTESKLKKTYKFVGDFFNSEEYSRNVEYNNKFSDSEINFLNELRVLELYVNIAIEKVQEYEKVNFSSNALQNSKDHGLKGKAINIAVNRYNIAQSVLEETIENKNHKSIFPLGDYRFYSIVFYDAFFQCVFEVTIMTVLITAYLINYENDNSTNALVLTTKRGRKNIKDKLFVSIVSSVIVSALILGFTLISLYLNIDIADILGTSVRSAFNWEGKFPYIFWVNNSVGVQLALTTIIILICSGLFSLITFIITSIVKNTYTSFFIFFIIFGVFIIFPDIPSKESTICMYMGYDLFNLIIRPSSFFTVRAPMILDKFYEIKVLIIWTVILSTLSIITIKNFKNENIN